MSDTVTSVEKHGTESLMDQVEVGKLLVSGGGRGYEVEWDADAKVTPMGSLVFFAQYLQTGGLMDRLCQGTPLAYSSNNAPKERDVLGTIALIYNWWNVFTRLAQPDQHMEAITSRPLLLHAVGRMVSTGRRKILRLTSTHAMSDQIQRVLNRIGRFLNRLARTAEQLSIEAVWAIILSVACVKWLRGKVLDPVVEGNQTLLRLIQ